MAADTRTTVDATWCDEEKWYIVPRAAGRSAWFSPDGDNWVDGIGRCVDGDVFANSIVRLVGGPRDGDVIS